MTATPEHPFMVAGKGWVEAGSLGVGTSIVTRAGPLMAVQSMSWQRQTGAEKASGVGGYAVYNFTVEGTHTYFVGDDNHAVLVHNTVCAYDVNTFGKLRSASDIGDGLQIHHAPQYANARDLGIPGYSYSNAPAIVLSDGEHLIVNAAQTGNSVARAAMNAPQLFADDINILQQHTNAPASAIQALQTLGAQFGL